MGSFDGKFNPPSIQSSKTCASAYSFRLEYQAEGNFSVGHRIKSSQGCDAGFESSESINVQPNQSAKTHRVPSQQQRLVWFTIDKLEVTE